MDVTCDNCKAEYDFDDTLLGDKGTTVKCSKCGHVFRVLPPRREPQRSALKVRFRDGRVESIASLRELQQRIQGGTVGIDDELGRDGFNFRRLGDVPELKNFFVRGAPTSAAAPKSSTAQPGPLPYRGEPLPGPSAGQPKRTIMGVGNVEVPPAPRVPNFNQVAAAQALAPTQPAAVHPKNTVQGRAPISSAPTSPGREAEPAARHREPPSQRIPVAGGPASTATAPTLPASAGFNPGANAFGSQPPTSAFNAPTASAPIPGSPTPRVAAAPISNAPTPRPAAAPVAGAASATPSATVPASSLLGGGASSTQPAPARRPAGPALRIPESADPRPQAAAPARPQGLDSIAPGVLKAALNPGGAAPKGPSGAPVRLALDDDEPRRPDGRARGGSSKLWLYALGLAALGAGGWALAGQLKPAAPAIAPSPTTSSPAPAPSEAAPDAGLAAVPETDPAAAAQAETEAAAAAAPAAEEPAPEPTAPAPSAAAPTAPSAAAPKAESKPASSSASGSGESGASREPKDYSGWVSRGDKLLKQGDHAGAQQAFEQAVALRGTGSEANSGLGAALLAQGQTREAIPYLTRAANNGFAEASVGLGDAYRKLGQKDAAIEAYETYLARLPRGARASYVKLQLEGLGRDPGGSKSAPSEPSSPPSDSYRPAGELTEPAPAAPETAP